MRIVFIGTGEIGVPVLRLLQASREYQLAAVVTQPDKPAGRDQAVRPPPIKQALISSKTPLFQPKRIKEPDVISAIRSLQPDVLVVMAYGQILPRDLLEVPRSACLNLHASLLPRWRGAAPIQAAIAAGDRRSGITVMYMDEGLDTGDILLQREIEIDGDDTGGSLHDRLRAIAPVALNDALALLKEGRAPRLPQDDTLATHSPKLGREQGRLDWAEPADILERKIRAFNPWPGAFTLLQGESGREVRLKIFSADPVDFEGSSGEVLDEVETGGLVIAAGTRALRLREVQLEGKRLMSAEEFFRGHSRLLQKRLR